MSELPELPEPNPMPYWFIGVLIAALVAGFFLVRVAYAHWYYMLAVFFIGSALMYQVWLYLYAHQPAYNLSHQYPSAWQGDLIVLPFLVGIPLYILHHNLAPDTPSWVKSWWFQIVAYLLGAVIAYCFRMTQKNVYPPDVLNASWKAWHDLFVFAFLAAVLIYGVPAVYYSKWGLRSLSTNGYRWLIIVPIVVGLVYFFGYLANVADRNLDKNATSPTQYAAVYGLHWRTMTVNGPYVVLHGYEWATVDGELKLVARPGKWCWVLPQYAAAVAP